MFVLKKFKIQVLFFLFAFTILSSLPAIAQAVDWTQNLVFYAPFTDPNNPLQVNVGSGAFTFTRTSSATYIHPSTGLVTVAGHNIARYSEDFSNTWIASSTSVNVDQVIAPDGTMSADELVVGASGDGSRTHFIHIAATSTGTIQANQVFTSSVYVKQNTNTWVAVAMVGKNGTANTCYFNTTTGAVGTCSANTIGTSVAAGNGFYRFGVSASMGSGSATMYTRIYLASADNTQTFTGNGANSVYIWGAQMNSGPVVAPYLKTTSDFVASPRIESAGYLAEGTRSNMLLWSRNMANTAWTKTNMTATQTATGHDGVANAASVVTATADAGTVCQAITMTATTSASVDIKRISGTGTISLSTDGGSTYGTDVSGSVSGSTWYRAVLENRPVTNPTFCVKLGTNGDSVALDYAQLEVSGTPTGPAGAPFISSRIPTTNTTATRFIDRLSIPSAGNWPTTEGSFFVIGDVWDTANGNKFFLDGTDPARVILHVRSALGNGSNGILGRTTIYDGSSECSYSSVNVDPQTTTKMATRWSATAGLRGSTASGATPFNCAFDGAIEIASPMVFGDAHTQDGSRSMFGHMKELRIWNTYFSDSYMQIATAGSLTAIGDDVDVTAPTISTIASTTGQTTASITWNTNEAASSTVQYGLSTSYGSQATSSATSTHSVSLSGLTAGTLYNFRVTAIDASGNIATTTNYTFRTAAIPDSTGPIFSDFTSTPSTNSAVIGWTTDELASSRIVFGLSSSLGSTTSETNTSPRVLTRSITLGGLNTCTKYFYKAVSIDGSTNVSTSSEQSFITTGCTSNAAVETIAVDTVTTSSGGSAIVTNGTQTATVTFPSNVTSTSSSFVVQTKIVNDTTIVSAIGTPSGLNVATDQIYDFKAYSDLNTSLSTFNLPVTITLAYPDSSIGNLIESSLKIYRYDGSTWELLTGCSVNAGANTVTCTTDHFSIFGIFGTPAATPVAVAPTNSSTPGGATAYGGYTPNESPAAILARLGSTPVTATPSNTTSIIRSPLTTLKQGTTNNEVKILQQILNSLGFLVSTSGAGSPGKETSFYGPATTKAVIRWQIANKVNPPSGFFGPLSLAKMKLILGK